MNYSHSISEEILFVKGPYQFRKSGHVFSRGLAYGLITYIRNPRIRAAWEAWLAA